MLPAAISDTSRLGLSIVVMALVLGVWGDMLRAFPLGVNVVFWIGALLLAGGIVARWRHLALTGEGRWCVWPALFFAAAFAWRDSGALQSVNGLALLATLALVALYVRVGQLRRAGLIDYGAGAVCVFQQTITGGFALLATDVHWQELPHARWSAPLMAVGRGIIIALPLLFLFGGLFVAADAVFQEVATRLLRWVNQELGTHLLCIGFLTWVVSGWLRQALLAQGGISFTGKRPVALSLGIIEVSVALGLLNLLFLIFVVVQVRYLFGGAALVTTVTGLTYAEYARRGFFELVAVAAVVLPLLLAAHWLLRKENPAHERLFRLLAGVWVSLLFVIMASAVQRLWLYQAAYGLTEFRFYAAAFMGWLASVVVWFVATVLWGQRERFAVGALVTGFVTVALLDGLNPDAVIVRTNVSRAAAGATFDAYYVSSLSADAVPVLVAALPRLEPEQRRVVAATCLQRWSFPTQPDWRTWNWSRARAGQVVEANRATLQNSLDEDFMERRYSSHPQESTYRGQRRER